MPYKNIIWDFDNTICETSPAMALAFQVALADFGRSREPEDIEPLIRLSIGYTIEVLAHDFALDEETLEQHFEQHYAGISLFEQPLYPHVKAFIENSHQHGIKHFLFTHRGYTSLNHFMESYQLIDAFTELVSVVDGYPKKPDPSGFLYLIDKYNLEPAATLGIGDREIDVLAARQSGIASCLFGSVQKLNNQPDYQIVSYGELGDIVF